MKLRGRYIQLLTGEWWVPLDTPQLAWLASIGWGTITYDGMN